MTNPVSCTQRSWRVLDNQSSRGKRHSGLTNPLTRAERYRAKTHLPLYTVTAITLLIWARIHKASFHRHIPRCTGYAHTCDDLPRWY
ncbi:hypothetical protein J6590_048228 [Homalodisca vitripennis]|nr:hypothetical protein J6590_048228 [Homalodisca vitripennis]